MHYAGTFEEDRLISLQNVRLTDTSLAICFTAQGFPKLKLIRYHLCFPLRGHWEDLPGWGWFIYLFTFKIIRGRIRTSLYPVHKFISIHDTSFLPESSQGIHPCWLVQHAGFSPSSLAIFLIPILCSFL